MTDSSLEGHSHRQCGGVYERAAERVTIRISGMSAEVERGLYRCSVCGHTQHTLEQREAAEQAAVAAIRAEHGLLTPREIRALRTSLGLTTAQLAELMYGAPKGIVEGWERGRYVQNAEADRMLRSLADPETLKERAARAGVVLPEPGALEAEGEEAAAEKAGTVDSSDSPGDAVEADAVNTRAAEQSADSAGLPERETAG